MSDLNEHYKVADFETDNERVQVYILKPGDTFERFGGSRHGLTVSTTPSLIVSITSAGGKRDLEYNLHAVDIWRSIMTAHANAKTRHTII